MNIRFLLYGVIGILCAMAQLAPAQAPPNQRGRGPSTPMEMLAPQFRGTPKPTPFGTPKPTAKPAAAAAPTSATLKGKLVKPAVVHKIAIGTVTLQIQGRKVPLAIAQMIAFHPNPVYQQAMCTISGDQISLTFSQPATAISASATTTTFETFAPNRELPLMAGSANMLMLKGNGKYIVGNGTLKLTNIRPAEKKAGYCEGDLTVVLKTTNGGIRVPGRIESAFTMGNAVEPAEAH